jgi:lysozyme family protein
MAQFAEAVNHTLGFEGGYTNNPDDPGGATKYGIEQRDMPDVNIRDITPDQAVQYYSEHYWKPLYSQITSQLVANKLFDAGVNIGVGTAVKLLQRALQINEDGVFGPNTLSATNIAGDGLLLMYKQVLTQHYQAIVAEKPTEAEFLAGWLHRANS